MGMFVESKLQEEHDELRIVRVWPARSRKFRLNYFQRRFRIRNSNKFGIEREQAKKARGKMWDF